MKKIIADPTTIANPRYAVYRSGFKIYIVDMLPIKPWLSYLWPFGSRMQRKVTVGNLNTDNFDETSIKLKGEKTLIYPFFIPPILGGLMYLHSYQVSGRERSTPGGQFPIYAGLVFAVIVSLMLVVFFEYVTFDAEKLRFKIGELVTDEKTYRCVIKPYSKGSKRQYIFQTGGILILYAFILFGWSYWYQGLTGDFPWLIGEIFVIAAMCYIIPMLLPDPNRIVEIDIFDDNADI